MQLAMSMALASLPVPTETTVSAGLRSQEPRLSNSSSRLRIRLAVGACLPSEPVTQADGDQNPKRQAETLLLCQLLVTPYTCEGALRMPTLRSNRSECDQSI